MTELYIDGVQVILPASMSTEVKRENPFFTKNGEYTYDITINLDNPVNRGLYAHINRHNIASLPAGNRNAILIADHRVYCNGTEIITGWTDEVVTIQIASGNSELNYFVGSDLLISSLTLCSTSPMINGVPNKNMINKLYPEIEACLTPVYDRAAGVMYNEWIHNRILVNGQPTSYQLLAKSNPADFDYISQPFLCAYIRKLLAAIGYSITVNDLETTIFKDLYISHVQIEREWAKMLPGWKVVDFLTEIENMFNMSFVIDSKAKTARLLFNNSYYLNAQLKHVQNVVDEFEVEKSEKSDSVLTTNANVSYSLPDNEYYHRRAISSYVLKTATKVTIPKQYAETEINAGRDYLLSWFTDVTHRDKNIIYVDEYTNRMWLFKGMENDLIPSPTYELVNEFAPIERDEASSEIELEMVPVELASWSLYLYDNGVKSLASVPYWLPTIDGATSTGSDDSSTETNLDTMISNATTEASESKGKIFLAFYRGFNNRYLAGIPANTYPMPYTDEYLPEAFGTHFKTNTDGATLRLTKLDELFYSGVYDIDEINKITITSYDPNVYDTRGVFVINNKKYVCRETTYTLTAEGRNKAWKGVFYPIRISDTETYQRWILSDGKWRDGGAWIDSGRWLDN